MFFPSLGHQDLTALIMDQIKKDHMHNLQLKPRCRLDSEVVGHYPKTLKLQLFLDSPQRVRALLQVGLFFRGQSHLHNV